MSCKAPSRFIKLGSLALLYSCSSRQYLKEYRNKSLEKYEVYNYSVSQRKNNEQCVAVITKEYYTQKKEEDGFCVLNVNVENGCDEALFIFSQHEFPTSADITNAREGVVFSDSRNGRKSNRRISVYVSYIDGPINGNERAYQYYTNDKVAYLFLKLKREPHSAVVYRLSKKDRYLAEAVIGLEGARFGDCQRSR